MTYDEALRYLASIEGLGIKLALENITQVLESLGDPQRSCPSLLISGTNGKGSVAAMIAAILARTGRRIGLYTSPHLLRYEERIIIDGRPVTGDRFAAAVGEVHDTVLRLLDAGALGAHPTHFETVTAAAFLHLARAEVDLAVLEVGMGGRLDATALAAPRLSIITNVDLEHTAYLGKTLEEIAFEKAGVLPEGGVLLTAESRPGPAAVFRERAREMRARLVEMPQWARVRVREGRLSIRTPRREHLDLEIALRGPHQAGNAALAVAACDLLEEIGFPVSEEAIRAGLKEVRWPGRFQIVEGSPRLILDGAHNPAGSRALAEALRSIGALPETTTLLFGVLRDKDHAAMLEALTGCALRVVLTRGVSPRFREPHAMAPQAREVIGRASAAEVTATENLDEGWREAIASTPPGGSICVCGSLYLVADAMRLLGIEAFPER